MFVLMPVAQLMRDIGRRRTFKACVVESLQKAFFGKSGGGECGSDPRNECPCGGASVGEKTGARAGRHPQGLAGIFAAARICIVSKRWPGPRNVECQNESVLPPITNWFRTGNLYRRVLARWPMSPAQGLPSPGGRDVMVFVLGRKTSQP